jgi:hypothetical protein
MERELIDYNINTAYNYFSGELDIEVYNKSGEYLGTLSGHRYDFDNITDDDIDCALSDGDYCYVTDDPFWDNIY